MVSQGGAVQTDVAPLYRTRERTQVKDSIVKYVILLVMRFVQNIKSHMPSKYYRPLHFLTCLIVLDSLTLFY
jgi:hypothetical protein